MKNASGSGCATVLILLLVIGFLGAYWPVILGIAVIAGIIYALIKWTSLKKEQKAEQNIRIETYKAESNSSVIPYKNSILNSNNGVTLSAGRYVGGRDLDIGIYNLFVISGSGIVKTDIPNEFHEFLSYERNNSYHNIEIIHGTVLKVDTGMKIKLYDRRDCITDEPIQRLENKKDYKLVNFDDMDGHAFEHFCADVLVENGYQNVQVTRGSGDQGVDILAE